MNFRYQSEKLPVDIDTDSKKKKDVPFRGRSEGRARN